MLEGSTNISDPYVDFAADDEKVQLRIAAAREGRCLEPAQIAICLEYLCEIELPQGALSVAFGSGTGHVIEDVVGAAAALGIEPSPVMVARANAQFGDVQNLRFETGDAKSTGFADASIDMVLINT